MNIEFYSYWRPENSNGFVYIFQYCNTNTYKIGYSKNPINRLYGLGKATHKFIWAIKTNRPRTLEKYLHNKFLSKRVEIKNAQVLTEYFDLSNNEIDFIKNIKSIQKVPIKKFDNWEKLKQELKRRI